MNISSRTPEGSPNLCPVCGKGMVIEPSDPTGDAPCPHCGHLLWFYEERVRSIVGEVEITIGEDKVGVVVKFPAHSEMLEPVIVQRIWEELLDDLASPHLILDFANVGFLSTAALGKLITLDKKVKARSGWLKLRNIRPEIFEVFRITRLDRLFTIEQ